MHSFWTKHIPSAPYVRTVRPWEATINTMDITDIPPHTTLLSKIEGLKCIIESFKVSVTRYIKVVLKDKRNAVEIGGSGVFKNI